MFCCELCTEEKNIRTIIECNHNDVCFACTLKMRTITKSKKCPLCNNNLESVIFSPKEEAKFESFDLNKLIEYKDGIYFEDEATQKEVQQVYQIRCPIQNCPDSANQFNGMLLLKRHLKERHSRAYCDICLDNRTLLLKEQKIFTLNRLDWHMKRGDLDDEGNVIFFHPYCQFCQINFYNEEKLVLHLQKEHYQCHLCDETRKYHHFKDYKSLEIHFNISHYLCPIDSCREKAFQVFASGPELEAHTAKFHSDGQSASRNTKNISQSLIRSITGFDYGQSDRFHKKEQKTFVKDREGVDFEPQFLSQVKIKTKLHLQTSNASEAIDLRMYFPNNKKLLDFDVTMIYNEMTASSNSHQPNNKREENYYDDYGDNRRYKKKADGRNKNYNPKPIANEPLHFEDCNMAYFSFINIDAKTLYDKFRELLAEKDYHTLRGVIEDYHKGRCDHKFLFSKFIEFFTDRATFKIFPFYLATLQKEETAIYLDKYFYEKMLELPKRNKSLISGCKTYGELFKSMHQTVEKEIIKRLEGNKFEISKKNIALDPARIFQMMQILRRVENSGTASLKFSTNFGVTVETKDKLTHSLTEHQEIFQKTVGTVSDFEIIVIYKYLELVLDKVEGRNINIDIKSISLILVENLLEKRPDLQEKFKSALGDNWRKEVKEDKLLFTTNNGLKRIRKKNNGPTQQIVNEAEYYSTRYEETKQFDSKNPFDFPELVKPKKPEPKKKKETKTETIKPRYEEPVIKASNSPVKQQITEKAAEPIVEEPVSKPKLPEKLNEPTIEKKVEKPVVKEEEKPFTKVEKTGFSYEIKKTSQKKKMDNGWVNQNPFFMNDSKSGKDGNKVEEDFPTLTGPKEKSQAKEAAFWKHIGGNDSKNPENGSNKKGLTEWDDEYWEQLEDDPNYVSGMKIAGVQKSKKGKQKVFLAGGFK